MPFALLNVSTVIWWCNVYWEGQYSLYQQGNKKRLFPTLKTMFASLLLVQRGLTRIISYYESQLTSGSMKAISNETVNKDTEKEVNKWYETVFVFSRHNKSIQKTSHIFRYCFSFVASRFIFNLLKKTKLMNKPCGLILSWFFARKSSFKQIFCLLISWLTSKIPFERSTQLIMWR